MRTSKRDPAPSDQFPQISRHYEVPDRPLKGYPTYTYKLGVPFKPEHRNVIGIVEIDRGRVTIAYEVVDAMPPVAVE